jgi:GAF domain-containing protein
VAIPLIAGPDLIGALAVYADEAHSFGPVEVQVFEELTRNVQFGIQSRRTRVAYQQSLQEQASQAQRWKMPWKMRWLPLPPSWSSATPTPPVIKSMWPNWQC